MRYRTSFCIFASLFHVNTQIKHFHTHSSVLRHDRGMRYACAHFVRDADDINVGIWGLVVAVMVTHFLRTFFDTDRVG